MSRNRILLLLLLAVVGACSSSRQSGPDVGPMDVERDVFVENGTSIDLEITVAVGATRHLMGRVRARGNRAIRLPRGISGSFVLIAEPLGGGGRLISEPIQVERARMATWEIRPTGSAMVTYRRGALRP